MKKRWFALFAAMLMGLSLIGFAACTQEPASGEDSDPTTQLPNRGDGAQEEGGEGETQQPAADIEIGTAQELIDWAARVNAGEDFSGQLLRLTADIDLSAQAWTPVDSVSSNLSGFTFDGGGYTIENMTVVKAASSSSGLAQNDPDADDAGFFGQIIGCSMEVRDVTFSNASVSGRYAVGVLIGWLQNSGMTLERVSIENSTVTAKKWFGGFFGCVEGSGKTIRATNISLLNSTVSEYDASDTAIRCGGVAGYSRYIGYDIQGGTISGNTLRAYHSVASVLGTITIADVESVTISGMTITDNAIYGHSRANYLHAVLNTDDWSYTGRDNFLRGNTVSGNTLQTDGE